MGIKGLTKFLADHAPGALRVEARASLLGRVVAVDTSMALYQFLTAVRDAQTLGNLTDESGKVTSHLAGMLSRVTRMLEQGIRPVFVFDGEAPEEKATELERRRERREAAAAAAAAAAEAGDAAELRKQLARSVRVTREQNEDVKRLLLLLGLPLLQAPGEAEAQCAALARAGKVWAAATEDADALTFGAPILLRNLTFSDSSSSSSSSAAAAAAGGRGQPVVSIHLDAVLQQLQLSMDQFIDFCILCGCDYCSSIKGVGPRTAYQWIRDRGSIEAVLASLKGDKFQVPDNFCFQRARCCFKQPAVAAPHTLAFKWADLDEQGLKQFLVNERTFSEARVEVYIQRLRKARGLITQTRLENFFGAAVSRPSDLARKQQQQQQQQQGSKRGKRQQRAAAPKALPPPAKRRASSTK
ncbi:flap endonuclease-1, putative [Eimeria tenella]|uniref:Flap endonuclease 1 n=1 Tax=Eimeria tenella TaxID=5802 RepID=U6L6E7_EIMTE|nr:flap endonuclease-1, putative [Eimeria tenella]CDJ44164.1 flap endonuclease-1, putative [Eimeria tenella]|eukprot:XP_013234913.1 flap endonuclease-1, putative [Eimeria tenella]